MENLLVLAGRFHPLLVHLPIGILVLAAIFQIAAVLRPLASLETAVLPSMVAGAFFSVLASVTGWILAREGGYDPEVVDVHRITGIATTVVAVTAAVLYSEVAFRTSRRVRIFTAVILLFAVSVTGHFGGSLTHGEDFLFPADAGNAPRSLSLALAPEVSETELYEGVVKPILEHRCYSCHSATKQKGQLRLDAMAHILAGGKSGQVLHPSGPDSSALTARIALPLEDKKHMPPRDKAQPERAETELLRLWVAGGASAEQKIGQHPRRERILELLDDLATQAPAYDLYPAFDAPKADEQHIATLERENVIVSRLESGSNWLRVNFVNLPAFNGPVLKALTALRGNVVWINAARKPVDSKTSAVFAQCTELRVLYLNSAAIDDESLVPFTAHPGLRTLNVSGTALTDASLAILQTMPALTSVYTHGSSMTAGALAGLSAGRPALIIDSGGYRLPALPGDTVVHRRRL